ELLLHPCPRYNRIAKVRIGPPVRVTTLVGAFSVLVVLFVQMPAGKALVNRARPVALATWERTPEPPSEPYSRSAVEAPVPRSVRLPAERIDRPRDTGRARTDTVSPHSNPRPNVTSPTPPRPLIGTSPRPDK